MATNSIQSLSQIKRRKCDSASAFNKSLCTKLFALEFCKLTLIDCDLCTTHHSLDVVALNFLRTPQSHLVCDRLVNLGQRPYSSWLFVHQLDNVEPAG